MAFARNAGFTSAIATDAASTAAGLLTPTRYNLAHVVSDATVGGIPYCPTAITETTSAGLTFNAAGTAGQGLAIAAGIATTDVQAFSLSQTWNAAGVTFGGFKFTVTDTASAAGSLAFQILGGAAGTTSLFGVTKAGNILSNTSVTYLGGTTASNAPAAAATSVRGFHLASNSTLLWGNDVFAPSTGDTGLSRISAALIGVGNGAQGSFAGSLKAATYSGMMGTGAGLGNMISTATVNTTAVPTTGAGPDILQTYDLPLNSFSAAAKGVHITAWGTSANTAEAKTIILYFGSTAILTNALTASIAGVWRIEADVYSTGTDAQQYVAQLVTTGTAGVALNDVEQGTSAQDDGAAITIKCTGTIGAPSTAAGLVQEGLIVRFMN